MQDRDLRVQFRLTRDEYSRYSPLIRTQHHGTWSSLVRLALREYWTRNPVTPSDNGVRQPAGEMTTPSLFTRAKKKPTRRGPSRRGKTTV